MHQLPASASRFAFSRRFAVVALAVLLFGGSLLLYAPSLGFGFIGYDENVVLLGHPNLYAQPSLSSSLHEILVGYFPREEPLIVRDLTWMLDARLFGFQRPLGYHLGNVVLNALDVVLLFLFLAHATRSIGWSALIAAFFGALAIHVEPVCWVMGRKDVLAAFFVLLALLLQSLALREKRPRQRWALSIAVFLCCPLAILAKFSAIVLFAVLGLFRIFAPFLDGTREPWEELDLGYRARTLVGLLPHAAVTVALYVWYQRVLAAFGVIGDRGPSPMSLQHLKRLALLVPASLVKTLGHIAWPTQHAISYLRPNVALPLSTGDIVGVVAFVLGSIGATVVCLRRRKDLAFFLFAFFLFMFPYFNIEYIGIWVADRYAYLASLCVVAILVLLVRSAWTLRERWAKIVATAALATMVVFSCVGLAYGSQHQQAFQNAHTFWNYELGRAQPSMLAFDSAAKTALADAAAAEAKSATRMHAVDRAVRIARNGIQYYGTHTWQPAPGYFSRDQTHLAGLFSALGLAMTLADHPYEERYDYFRRAYQIMPNKQTALLLAQALLDLARRDPPDEMRARESLGFFRKYLEQAKADPTVASGLPSLLAQYTQAFPGLAAEVQRISDEVLQ